MTDDMIRALAKNGGVMDINYYSGFLSQAFADAYAKIEKQVDAQLAETRASYASQTAKHILRNSISRPQ